MSDKVYEMYEDYYEAEAQLQELIDARDMLKKSLNIAQPNQFAEGWLMLIETNKKIDKCRATLKAEYDAHQELCRAKEKYDNAMSEMKFGMYGSLIYIKHCLPDKFEEALATMHNDLTPEEIEEFNKEMAHLEATRLEEFIGEKNDDISGKNLK